MNKETHSFFRRYHGEDTTEKATEEEAKFSLSCGWNINDGFWQEFLMGNKYKTPNCMVWAEAITQEQI